ncbi:hypothetical protein D3C71_1200480 [compost metagenome]
MPEHGLRSRTDSQTFFKHVSTSLSYPWQFGIKAFNMILFLLKETLWNEHWKISITMPSFLEATVHFLLNMLPYFIALWLKYDTATNRRVVHQVSFFYNINIPA